MIRKLLSGNRALQSKIIKIGINNLVLHRKHNFMGRIGEKWEALYFENNLDLQNIQSDIQFAGKKIHAE